ncbi:hypothetical protein DBV15_10439 [Temnothorax longispinosus]|uniref:Uncharacterized protein n=1 Tax=Temnothorax longispinosus TaxID=300112 RepID=A0A4S2KRD2_9HYME|nr:hypothetical protein DBV15_10439 [Temnothorax longispinosus]
MKEEEAMLGRQERGGPAAKKDALLQLGKREKLPERRKREREEGEGKNERDGRAKNRQRPGRKEGAENEGELRSVSESPEASWSALSRWISSGQHRSLSFSLSPPFPAPDSPFDHLSHWDTKVERTKLAAISSRFRARSGTTVPLPHHFTVVGCRVPRVYPRGHLLAHNDRDEREKKKGEDGRLSSSPTSRDPAPSPAGQPKRLAQGRRYVGTITSPAFACIARGGAAPPPSPPPPPPPSS